jgi:hypothetical protein
MSNLCAVPTLSSDCEMGWTPAFRSAPHGVSSGLQGFTSTFLVELSQSIRWKQASEFWLGMVAVALLGDRTADPTGPLLHALKLHMSRSFKGPVLT